MAVDRERIAAALFRAVSQAANFTTIDRRLRHWADTSPAEQPALFMSEKGGEGRTESNMSNAPVVWTLNFDFYIYVYQPDRYLSPAMQLNPLIDAVERALAPSPVTGWNTLGLEGMVIWARVLGRLMTDEGVLNDQAMAIIPVEVRAV